MACRVGSQLTRKKKTILAKPTPSSGGLENYSQRLKLYGRSKKEVECARSDGCESHPGGQGIAGNIWSVYRFDY